MTKSELTSKLWEAFTLGWGYGQGKMEEDIDNNFFDAFLQYNSSNAKGGGSAPCHTVQIPNTFDINEKNQIVNIRPDFENKYVRYKLHSNEWREAMLSKMDDFLQIIKEINSK